MATMKSKILTYIIPIVSVLALLFFVGSSPGVVDWYPNYTFSSKKPISLEIFRDNITRFIPDSLVEESRASVYETLSERPAENMNYVFIRPRADLDSLDFHYLLQLAEAGGTIFIAAHVMPTVAEKHFSIKEQNHYRIRDSIAFVYNHDGNDYIDTLRHFNDRRIINYFDNEYDPELVLATKHIYAERPAAVRRTWGRGTFIFVADPQIFTNAYLLYGGTVGYASALLSLLPPQQTILDAYYFTGRSDSRSQLQLVLKDPALIYVYYIVLFLFFLTLIFNLKRKQRAVPVIEPPENTTLNFIKMVAGIYLEKNEHDSFFRKKLAYFYLQVREKYLLSGKITDPAFRAELHQKSGIPLSQVETLANAVLQMKQQSRLQAKDLLKFNNLIESITARLYRGKNDRKH
jgi:hypothetical protein